jgi:preprotein translocase subunit SecB
MKEKEIVADFQFLGNRVNKLVVKTKPLIEKGRPEISFDFDYNVDEIVEEDNIFLGILQLIIQVKAKIKNRVLFEIELVMEGGFTGNPERLSIDKFAEMVEINGLITLLHISRAYLVSVTAQSGITPPVRIPMINILKLREAKQHSSK